jgi:hypothetical protein
VAPIPSLIPAATKLTKAKSPAESCPMKVPFTKAHNKNKQAEIFFEEKLPITFALTPFKNDDQTTLVDQLQ